MLFLFRDPVSNLGTPLLLVIVAVASTHCPYTVRGWLALSLGVPWRQNDSKVSAFATSSLIPVLSEVGYT